MVLRTHALPELVSAGDPLYSWLFTFDALCVKCMRLDNGEVAVSLDLTLNN